MSKDDSPQKKGGHARASALSAEEKKAISRRAALARWDTETPRSTHEGEFYLGDVLVSAAVLPNRQRLLTQGTFLRALGRSRSPKGGAGMFATVDGTPFFLQSEVLKPFITEDLLMSTTPVFFIDKTGAKALGYDARILPNVADVYLKYRDSVLVEGKELPARYRDMVRACDALVRFLAQRGIVALVDQATGYTEDLERDVIARMLEAWVSETLRPYLPTFPIGWFKEICRLKGWKFSPTMRMPRYFGKIINDLAYDRVGYGVRQWLDERTPVGPDGRRKHKKFQRLTKDFGINQLLHHLGVQQGMMMGYGDGEWGRFYEKTQPHNAAVPKASAVRSGSRYARTGRGGSIDAAAGRRNARERIDTTRGRRDGPLGSP